MDSEPDFQLLETRLETGLEVNKELSVLLCIFSINEYSIETIAILNPSCAPNPFDCLRFPRYAAEPGLNLGRCVGKKVARHFPPIIERQR